MKFEELYGELISSLHENMVIGELVLKLPELRVEEWVWMHSSPYEFLADPHHQVRKPVFTLYPGISDCPTDGKPYEKRLRKRFKRRESNFEYSLIVAPEPELVLAFENSTVDLVLGNLKAAVEKELLQMSPVIEGDHDCVTPVYFPSKYGVGDELKSLKDCLNGVMSGVEIKVPRCDNIKLG